ncbi:MAG TPA: bifunctional phosphoribosylaminoimidazolecarboxamide formyltransferase/IMP cyclohydrolase [Gammaproteobacteria bacterium]
MKRPSRPRRRALLSVADKKGLVPFAEELVALGFDIVSTGGTAALLREAGVPVINVTDITGFPEIMDGRVKTLHPSVHGGLLARAGKDDAALRQHGIERIDLAVVNLYPFGQVVANPKSTDADAIENIDVGGPAMIRAAAKNHARVAVVVDPADYEKVLERYRGGKQPPAAFKRQLATKAFAYTAAYDAQIASYLGGRVEDAAAAFPERLVRAWQRKSLLRYGENPHQSAALYVDPGAPAGALAAATLIQGKPLSFNNLTDADAALACVRSWTAPACVIVKHANPCGVATGKKLKSAYERAYSSDPTSAYGGVIAFNRTLDAGAAEAILDNQFAEVIVAPKIEARAAEVLERKANIRVLECGEKAAHAHEWELQALDGGVLLQERDWVELTKRELKVVTKRKPTRTELRDLMFAWKVVRHVKSNAIVLAQDERTLGIGAGQMSRVMSVRIAVMQAQEQKFSLKGAVMASDAFFPFRDGLEVAAKAGVTAVIQPGGSVRDEEVIMAANKYRIAMVFTGRRHFKH